MRYGALAVAMFANRGILNSEPELPNLEFENLRNSGISELRNHK
jgi:hypothetical protein